MVIQMIVFLSIVRGLLVILAAKTRAQVKNNGKSNKKSQKESCPDNA